MVRLQQIILLSLPSASIAAFGVVVPSSTSTSFGRRAQPPAAVVPPSSALGGYHHSTTTPTTPTSLHYVNSNNINSPSLLSVKECLLDEFIEGCNASGATTTTTTEQPQRQKKLGISLSPYMKDVTLSSEIEKQMNDETRENIRKIVDNGIQELNDLSNKLQRDVAHPYESDRVQWNRVYQKNEKNLRKQLDNKICDFLKDTQKYRQETHDKCIIDDYMRDTYARQAQARSHGIKYEVLPPTKQEAQTALLRAKALVTHLRNNKKVREQVGKLSSSSSKHTKSGSSSIDERWDDDDIDDDFEMDW